MEKVELLYTDKNNEKYSIETFDTSSKRYHEELYGYINNLLIFKFDGKVSFLGELGEICFDRALVRDAWNKKDVTWGSCYDIPLNIAKYVMSRHGLEIIDLPIKG